MKNQNRIEAAIHTSRVEADYFAALERITKLEARIAFYDRLVPTLIDAIPDVKLVPMSSTYEKMDQEDQYQKGVA